jgi:hypothetical protein
MTFDIDKKIAELESKIETRRERLEEAEAELKFALAMKAANRETAHLVDTDEEFRNPAA